MGCSETNIMTIEKPYYYAKVNMNNCPRAIAINGFEIERDLDGEGKLINEYPINPYIREGENTLELIFPNEEFMKDVSTFDSKCNVSIWVKGTANKKDINLKITDLDYLLDFSLSSKARFSNSEKSGTYKYNLNANSLETTSSGNVIIGDISLENELFEGAGDRLQRTFTAHVPFPQWKFFSAERIFEYPMTDEKFFNMENEVWPLVQSIWDLFDKKDVEGVLFLFAERSAEYDLAFYREKGETLRLLRESIQSNYDEGYPLNRLDLENMQLNVAYNEKLVTMQNAGTGNGTVMFYYQEADMNIFYDVYWMKIDGKWVIGR